MGLAGIQVYCRFIPQFSRLALPLLDLIPQTNAEYSEKLSQPVVRKAIERSILSIKEVITSAPALASPEKGNSEFLVRTDPPGFAIGATLHQIQRDTGIDATIDQRILGYFSRKLSGLETRYLIYDQELLAVRDAIEHWRYYLHGSHLIVQTDHSSLQHVLRQPKLSSHQMRLIE